MLDRRRLRRRPAPCSIEGGRIAAVVADADIPAAAERHDLDGAMLAARLHRHAGQWRRRRAVQRCADGRGDRGDRRGAPPLRHHRLPADPDQRRSLRSIRAGDRRGRCRRSRAGVPGVLGIHIEGPFLNVDRKGIHDPARSARWMTKALPTRHRPEGGADAGHARARAHHAGDGRTLTRRRRHRRRRAYRWHATPRSAPRWTAG